MFVKNDILLKIFGKVEIATMIKKIEGKKLKQTEKNYLHRSIRPKLIASGLIAESHLLKKINSRKKGHADIIEYNLSLYGYPMMTQHVEKHRMRKIPIENLIATILVDIPHARYIEAIPLIIAKNKIDPLKLLELAVANNIKNKIGYLLETSLMLKPSKNLEEILDYLGKNKDQEIAILSGHDQAFLEKTSPERIKRWNLLGRFYDDDFKKIAEAYL